MIDLALSGLEAAMNKYLQLDPDAIKRLAVLQGKIIKIEITDWPITFYVAPTHHGLQLTTHPHEPPDVIIKGPFFKLIRTANAKGSRRASFDREVTIEGDLELAQKFHDGLQRIDIDWEEHLSKIVGDSIAHKSFFYGKQFLDSVTRTADILKENIKEYFHEEAKLFPSALQLEEFYQQISLLRDDVDRLEVRIHRLIKAEKKSS